MGEFELRAKYLNRIDFNDNSKLLATTFFVNSVWKCVKSTYYTLLKDAVCVYPTINFVLLFYSMIYVLVTSN